MAPSQGLCSRWRNLVFLSIIATLLFLLLRQSRSCSSPTPTSLPTTHLPSSNSSPAQPSMPEKLAYVTWLGNTQADQSQKSSSNSSPKDKPEDQREDVYLTATRILIYQILHAPSTRSPSNLPILVLTTPDVAPATRALLTRDGATVIPIEFVKDGSDWIKPRRASWADVMSKLRAWQLFEYDRLLMLDGDFMLRRPLDGVFAEANASLTAVLDDEQVASPRKADEAALPAEYLLASGPEVNGVKHGYPPTEAKGDFIHPTEFNLGFVLFKPSAALFAYYMSVARIPDRFYGGKPEQMLLNYAHRPGGPMPWRKLPSTWNVRSPTEEDLLGGVGSLHDKWWRRPQGYPKLEGWYTGLKTEMEEFYERREATEVVG